VVGAAGEQVLPTGWTNWNGHHDTHRPPLAHDLTGSASGGPSGDAVIDDDHHPLLKRYPLACCAVRVRAIGAVAIRLCSAFDLAGFAFGDRLTLCFAETELANHIVVHDPDARFANRAPCQFWLPGNAKFADHDDVERRLHRSGYFGSHWQAASRQTENHDVFSAPRLEGSSEPTSGVASIHELRLRSEP
jgi:hypothetical protein